METAFTYAYTRGGHVNSAEGCPRTLFYDTTFSINNAISYKADSLASLQLMVLFSSCC